MQMEWELENVGFFVEGRTGVIGLRAATRINKELNRLKYNDESRATLVGGEWPHYCAIAAPRFGFADSSTQFIELLRKTDRCMNGCRQHI